MIDREKTISGLKEIADYFNECRGNASFGSKAEEHFWELQSAARDAVELLKKQKAVEPKLVGVNTWTCGKCGALLGWEEFSQSGLELVKYKFCPECGQAVKWDD